MRWQCDRDGCFNDKHRVRLFDFDECFPGRIGFTDVDGLVEIGGRALMLEWKSRLGDLPTGQRIMFERLTNTDALVVCVIHGNAARSEVKHVRWVQHGAMTEWEPMTLDELRARFAAWARWARAQSPARVARLTGIAAEVEAAAGEGRGLSAADVARLATEAAEPRLPAEKAPYGQAREPGASQHPWPVTSMR